VNRLLDGSGGSCGAAQRVEKHELVDGAVVAHTCRAHTRLGEPAGVGFPFVAQDVVLIDDYQSLGQTREVIDAGAQRRGSDLGAPVLLGQVGIIRNFVPNFGIEDRGDGGGVVGLVSRPEALEAQLKKYAPAHV
jgi:hypothetical protein